MSGDEVSYNLRPNKYVERQLFIDLLAMIVRDRSPDKWVYISLGGPQLEDHKLIHKQLRLQHLISIELDDEVWRRQEFNRSTSYIQCKNMSTGDFISSFDEIANPYSDNGFVIWLDYASPKERLDQLLECQELLGKLQVGDVLKITLNANPATLGEKMRGEPDSALLERRYATLQEQLGDHYPSHLYSAKDMIGRRLPRILCHAVKWISLEAVKQSSIIQPVPLAVFSYQTDTTLCLRSLCD